MEVDKVLADQLGRAEVLADTSEQLRAALRTAANHGRRRSS